MNTLGRLASSRVAREVAKKIHLDAILRPVYRWWTTLPQVVNVRPLGLSYKMRLDPQELSDSVWEFEHGERDFLEALKNHLRPGETALDVGAHFGEFSLALAIILGERGRVLSFEPEKRIYQRLAYHVKLNGLTNIRLFRKALGDKDKAGKIFLGGEFCPSIVPLEDDLIRRNVREDIEIVRGDTFFARENLPVPHAVKIDVEGFEYSVLQGLRDTLANPICRLACVEIHPEVLPPGVSGETITELLRSFGFGHFDATQRDTELHLVAVKTGGTP